MVTIPLSRLGNRGVSLLVLIFALVILSIFGTGLAMLMYAKFRSFPYMMSSHQAQALADAGAEFALRYVKDNAEAFSLTPGTFIPSSSYKYFSYENGQFGLRYEPAVSCTPGQLGNLYCKGVIGSTTREVKITDFGAMIDMANGNALLRHPQHPPMQSMLNNDWGGPSTAPLPIYFDGWSVAFWPCGIFMYGGQSNVYVPVTWTPPSGGGSRPTLTVAVSYPDNWPNGLPTDPPHPCRKCPPQYTYPWAGDPTCTGPCSSPLGTAQPLMLGRLVISSYDAISGHVAFVWDEVCDRHPSLYSSEALIVPHWDGVTIPPPAGEFLRPTWNVSRRDNYPFGKRHYSSLVSTYCYHGFPDPYPGAALLWNSESYPIQMHFEDVGHTNRPPAGTKYYIGLVTAIYDSSTGLWRNVENRWVFTADP